MIIKRLKIQVDMENKKSLWPVFWSIVRYAITAVLGYLSNGVI